MSNGVLDRVSIRGDEYYTRRQDVETIADNLINGLRIWCPFDTDDSQFPVVLRERGYDVVNTSSDFFTTEKPEGCNAIVSNPPFSKKKDVLKRCADLKIQFALILPFLLLHDYLMNKFEEEHNG